MSKRHREDDDEELLPLPPKYTRGEEGEQMGLVDFLLVDGLSKAFFQTLLDPLSQRAICCVNQPVWESTQQWRSPLAIIVPVYPPHSYDDEVFEEFCGADIHNQFWRAQLGLAMHYDHPGRARSARSSNLDHHRLLNWSIAGNAIKCATWVLSTYVVVNWAWVDFNRATNAMLSVILSLSTTVTPYITRHILEYRRYQCLVDLIDRPPFYLTRFLIALRGRVKVFKELPDRVVLMQALKPYGKAKPEENPRPLRDLLVVLIEYARKDTDPHF
jgi:hypothetical protein